MTAWTGHVPFTVDTDLDLGSTAAPWLRACGADVTIRRGVVPDALPDAESEGVAYQSAPGRMLIAPPCGVRFLVEGGTTIRYASGGATDADVRLFLLGSAWAALALQRGLLPMHMSAVGSVGGDIHAFTGPPGAGKSTPGRGTRQPRLSVLRRRRADSGPRGIRPGSALLRPPGLQAVARRAGADRSRAPGAGARGRGVRQGLCGTAAAVAAPRRSAQDPARAGRSEGRRRRRGFLPPRTRLRPPSRGDARRRRVPPAVHGGHLGRRRLFRCLAALGRHVDVFLFHRPTASGRFGEGVAHLAAALPAPADGVEEPELCNG